MSKEEVENDFLIHEIPLRPKFHRVDVTYLCKQHEAVARQKALKETLDSLANDGKADESMAPAPIVNWPRMPG